MAYSGIGGQAVMEGVMMKNQDTYAVAVRKPDHEIIVEKKDYVGICKNAFLKNLIFIRGIFNFIDSMVLGMSCLAFSASFYEEEKELPGGQPPMPQKQGKFKENLEMGLTVALTVVLAVVIFMVFPFYASLFLQRFLKSETLVLLAEGLVRILVFVGYILLISRMQDIKRVFMYHGAEHKCINCIEHGLDLTLENVRKSSREHKRCGTSFLFVVIIVSVVATMFIRVDSKILRLVLRLAVIPLIAGVSYEFIRLAGRSENPFINFLSKPGMLLQRLTTREPDDEMIEVGIASVEAVFDWKGYVERLRANGLEGPKT